MAFRSQILILQIIIIRFRARRFTQFCGTYVSFYCRVTSACRSTRRRQKRFVVTLLHAHQLASNDIISLSIVGCGRIIHPCMSQRKSASSRPRPSTSPLSAAPSSAAAGRPTGRTRTASTVTPGRVITSPPGATHGGVPLSSSESAIELSDSDDDNVVLVSATATYPLAPPTAAPHTVAHTPSRAGAVAYGPSAPPRTPAYPHAAASASTSASSVPTPISASPAVERYQALSSASSLSSSSLSASASAALAGLGPAAAARAQALARAQC